MYFPYANRFYNPNNNSVCIASKNIYVHGLHVPHNNEIFGGQLRLVHDNIKMNA